MNETTYVNDILPTKSAPELDAERELAEYIQRCRIMHRSITGSPRFAHAVSALADERDALIDRVRTLEAEVGSLREQLTAGTKHGSA